MLDRLLALESFGIKLGLANITALCEALGHPERAFASLHVAGTNGKGSVTAMAHRACRAAGILAARYTSPHLVQLSERFVIGDEEVAEDDLERVGGKVLDLAAALVRDGRLPAAPTFFEATTAIAFELFRAAGVRVAVLEVGLGGRFDATNVVDPVAGAITAVGMDHQQYLGDSLAQIAREKAGIIKPGMPVVCGPLPAEAAAVVEEIAAARGARVGWALEECEVASRAVGDRVAVDVRSPRHAYDRVTLGLRGEHQVGNAVVAVRLLEAAADAGLPIGADAIRRGLSEVSWPARLEALVFPGGRELLLDAAHNPDGAAALAAFLQRFRDRPALVFATMRDKDVTGILRALLPQVSAVIVTAAPSPRAASPDELARAVVAMDASRTPIVEPDPVLAIERAWREHRVACVAGSIFLAGAVREAFYPRAIVDSSP
jgi:dihydrofolate synthase/folylpolyglutamate synthase